VKTIRQLNKERLLEIKQDGPYSHGMELFINAIQEAQQFNERQPQGRRTGEEYRQKKVTVYFSWETNNRLMAHIITNNQSENPTLSRLVIPEAGHRLYANYKDGYQVNGGGYNKPFHILEAMVYQVSKHIDVNKGVSHWQDFIKAEVI